MEFLVSIPDLAVFKPEIRKYLTFRPEILRTRKRLTCCSKIGSKHPCQIKKNTAPSGTSDVPYLGSEIFVQNYEIVGSLESSDPCPYSQTTEETL